MIRVFSPTRHGIPLLAIAMVSFAGWSIAAKHDPRVAASPPISARQTRTTTMSLAPASSNPRAR